MRRTCERLRVVQVSNGMPGRPRRLLTSQNTSVPASMGDEVELAPARAVVAREERVAEALEVLGGELLAAPAERVSRV